MNHWWGWIFSKWNSSTASITLSMNVEKDYRVCWYTFPFFTYKKIKTLTNNFLHKTQKNKKIKKKPFKSLSNSAYTLSNRAVIWMKLSYFDTRLYCHCDCYQCSIIELTYYYCFPGVDDLMWSCSLVFGWSLWLSWHACILICYDSSIKWCKKFICSLNLCFAFPLSALLR